VFSKQSRNKNNDYDINLAPQVKEIEAVSREIASRVELPNDSGASREEPEKLSSKSDERGLIIAAEGLVRVVLGPEAEVRKRQENDLAIKERNARLASGGL
jgi:hypothetical protein